MQGANPIIGRYILWSAASSWAGKTDELGNNKPSHPRNQRRARVRHPSQASPITASQASAPNQTGGTAMAGSTVNPHGSTSIRRYRKITTPCVSKYDCHVIAAWPPAPDPGVLRTANNTRIPAASESANMTAMGFNSLD